MYHFFTLRRVSFYFFFVYHKIIFLTYASVSFHFILYNFNLLQFVLLLYFFFILCWKQNWEWDRSQAFICNFFFVCFFFAIVKSVEFWLTFYMNNYYLLCLSLFPSLLNILFLSFYLQKPRGAQFFFHTKKYVCFFFYDDSHSLLCPS